MAFGNVNVSYKPCKSVGQLKSAEKYMLGKELSQIKSGVVKTQSDLYMALGCDRDNFSNNVLVTRKLHGKSYSKMKENNILAHKMSISFHPADNPKFDYRMAYEIARQFAEKFMHEKGHEVLFAVHTDSKHVHVHFLVSNCNMNTGKSYRRNKKDLWDMSEYFGEKCLEYGLTNSVREEFYNKDLDRQKDKITFAEKKMAERGAETFKEELREVIREEIQNPVNLTFDDVVRALRENWNVETRVAGNTISYRHPEYRNKKDELVSVRGSKLGDLFTVKGVKHELTKKSAERKQSLLNADIPTARTVEPVNATGRIEPIMESNSILEIGRTADGRGQVSSYADVRNNEPNLPNLDGFYDRYRKTLGDNQQSANQSADDDERETVKAVEPPKRVRNKGAR
jgi:hypothetical protein